MKPKNLKHPFSFENRKVMIDDGVFYVPPYIENYDSFVFPGWKAIFGNEHPVHIEYCSGNGKWIAERAAAHPQINWVAVEKRFDRVRKLWSKKQNLGLDNLLVVCAEGVAATQAYFPSNSVSHVYVNFPDPWPKDRHAKHRIIQQPFVREMERLLLDDGEVTLVTDDPTYSGQMVAEMLQSERFRSFYPAPFYATDVEDYGDSYFGDLWRSMGRTIHFHRFLPKVEASV